MLSFLEKFVPRVEKLETACAALEAQNTELRAELAAQVRENEKLQAQICSLTLENADLGSQLRTCSRLVDVFQACHENAKHLCDEFLNKTAAVGRAVAGLCTFKKETENAYQDQSQDQNQSIYSGQKEEAAD